MSRKKIFLIVGVVFILLAIPVTVFLISRNQDIRQRATPATTLELSPQSYTATVGQQFSLDVVVDAGFNQVTGADITVVFDPDILEAESITKGNFLPNILVAGDVAPGSASIALGAPSTTPGTGAGTIATISFIAQKASSTPISVRFAQPDTQVVGIGEQGNVLVGSTPAVITVSGGSGGSPNPTTVPTAAPSSSPSGALSTTILQPNEGSITTAQPIISGTTFDSATVTLTITGITPITSIVTATSTGSWSFTPSTTLETGAHTITATAQDPVDETIETVTRTFTVEGSSAAVATTSGIPVAGSIGPTAAVAITGSIFLILGALALVL